MSERRGRRAPAEELLDEWFAHRDPQAHVAEGPATDATREVLASLGLQPPTDGEGDGRTPRPRQGEA